jgi:hypothetical protein
MDDGFGRLSGEVVWGKVWGSLLKLNLKPPDDPSTIRSRDVLAGCTAVVRAAQGGST